MRRIIPIVLAAIALTACSSIDCPLYNQVYSKYMLDGEVTMLSDTLYVSTTKVDGKDTTLINRLYDASDFLLKMSFTQPEDVLYFTFKNPLTVRTDTVRVSKTTYPHFESVDCSPSFFHQIEGVSTTRHAIDSIIIAKKIVNYDTTGCHLRIYLKPGD